MSNNRQVAGAILTQAKKVITTERGQQHGPAEGSFEAIGAMWTEYLNQANIRETGMPLVGLHIGARDVALMMAQMKMVRIVWGDKSQIDNYVDGAGYFSLAGMFGMPDSTVAAASGEAGALAEQAVAEALTPQTIGEALEVIHEKNREQDIPAFLKAKGQ